MPVPARRGAAPRRGRAAPPPRNRSLQVKCGRHLAVAVVFEGSRETDCRIRALVLGEFRRCACAQEVAEQCVVVVTGLGALPPIREEVAPVQVLEQPMGPRVSARDSRKPAVIHGDAAVSISDTAMRRRRVRDDRAGEVLEHDDAGMRSADRRIRAVPPRMLRHQYKPGGPAARLRVQRVARVPIELRVRRQNLLRLRRG